MTEKCKYDYSYFENISNAIQEINNFTSFESGIINGLLYLLHEHDLATYNHTLIVADLAFALARESGLTEAECRKIQKGALLHDIGKLFVPKKLLQRQNGDYVSPRQMELLKSHGKMGQEIIHSFADKNGHQKLDIVYEFIADQHNIGVGKVESPQADIDRRHELVPYVSIADFVASALDVGKKSLRTFEFEECIELMNRRFDKKFLPENIRKPFNSLMRKIGPLSYNTSIGYGNLYTQSN